MDAAVKQDYAAELDLHVTHSGLVLVFHDRSLSRMFGIERSITTVDADDLPNLRLPDGGEQIPQLTEVLHLVDRSIPLLLELKTGPDSDRLASGVFELIQEYEGPLAIQSFDKRVVGWFSENAKDIVRGQLAGAGNRGWLHQRSRLRVLRQPSVDFVAFNVNRLPNSRVARLRARGLPILAWTIRTGTQQRIAEAFADNLIFESWGSEDPVRV